MALSLEVIKFRDILRVESIPRLIPGAPVTTVELKGEDFNSADVVTINDMLSPAFIIVNKHTIFAELPEHVRQISKVAVLSSRFTTTGEASQVVFQVGKKTRSVTGVLKLTQLFIKILLTTPGRDVFDKSIGGGLLDLVGQVTSVSRSDKALAAVAKAVSNTAAQIKRTQLNVSKLPLNERLLSAELIDLRMLKGTDEARARVQITSVAGVVGVAAVEL